MAKGEISKNPVYSMFESHFPFSSFCVNVVSAQPSDFNQPINCAFKGHDKPDSSFVTFINLCRGSDFVCLAMNDEFSEQSIC